MGTGSDLASTDIFFHTTACDCFTLDPPFFHRNRNSQRVLLPYRFQEVVKICNGGDVVVVCFNYNIWIDKTARKDISTVTKAHQLCSV